MGTYNGSCHCRAGKYEIEADLTTITRCTCSVCTKKGILLARVDPDKLRIIDGEDKLKLYQFNKMVAKHYFCPECGIHTFGHPRAAPDKVVVNVNTLDDYDVHSAEHRIRVFDGRNWEKAFADIGGGAR